MDLHLAHPTGLWLFALFAPLLLMYLLRHRRPPRRVPSVFLFRRTERTERAERSWRKLLPELSLLLQLALLALLALLAARPTFGSEQTRQGALGIVVDISASMASHEEGGTRLHLARAATRRLLREYAGVPVHLVFAGAEPRLAAGRDEGSLTQELDDVDAEDVSTDLPRALALLDDKLRDQPRRQIVILTDVNQSFSSQRSNLTVQRFGERHWNLALTSARAHRNERTLEISTIAIAHGDEPREASLVLRELSAVTGAPSSRQPLDVRRVSLTPGQRTEVRFSRPNDERAAAYEVAFAESADALGRDDRVVVVPPPSAKLPVWLYTSKQNPNRPLARALLANDRVDLHVVAPTQPGDVPADAFEIFENHCPSALRGRSALIVAPPPGTCLDVHVSEPSPEVRTLDGFRSDDPRVRFLSLDDVHLRGGQTLRPRGGEGILAEDRTGPLIVDADTNARRIAMLGFDPEQSDFPSKRSFVVFLRNLTELADRQRTMASRNDLRAGVPGSLGVPGDITEVTFAFDGQERRLPAREGEVLLAALPRAGLGVARYERGDVRGSQTGVLLAAIHFAGGDESDLWTLAGEASPSAPPSRSDPAPTAWLDSERLRRGLLILTLLVLMFEVFWFAKKPAWSIRKPRPSSDPRS